MRRMRVRSMVAAQPARWRRSRALVSVLFAAAFLGAGDAAAQNLEEYDYENLRLRAIGVDVVWANAKDAEGAVGFGARADLVLFTGDPIADLAVLDSPRAVVQDGNVRVL